jgi:hypothetical protein
VLFAVVQYPLADSRVFLGTDAARLARPDWLTPSLYADFVRAFGLSTGLAKDFTATPRAHCDWYHRRRRLLSKALAWRSATNAYFGA